MVRSALPASVGGWAEFRAVLGLKQTVVSEAQCSTNVISSYIYALRLKIRPPHPSSLAQPLQLASQAQITEQTCLKGRNPLSLSLYVGICFLPLLIIHSYSEDDERRSLQPPNLLPTTSLLADGASHSNVPAAFQRLLSPIPRHQVLCLRFRRQAEGDSDFWSHRSWQVPSLPRARQASQWRNHQRRLCAG